MLPVRAGNGRVVNLNYGAHSLPGQISKRSGEDSARPGENPERQTLLDFFNGFANLPGQFLLYYDGYRTWNYGYTQVARAAGAFAAWLREQSIGKGEKVILWSENRPEWVAAFWGCLLEGVIVVPVDYRASLDVVRSRMEIAGARMVLAGDDIHASAAIPQMPLWRLSDLDWTGAPVPEPAAQIGKDDIAEIVFTSGATGNPKGVVITHRNIMADLAPVEREVLKYRKYVRAFFPIRFLNLLPLSHMFGQALALFFAPMLPGVVIFMRGYSPHEIVSQIRKRRVSFLVAVPKMLEVFRRYVVRQFPEAGQALSRDSRWLIRWWRYRRVHRMLGWKFWGFVVGGAPLEPGLEEFWSRMGFLVVQGYGLTETAPIISFNHPFRRQPRTVGEPLAGVEVKVAPDGEILVRGEIVTPGYLNQPAETKHAFEDGWFHTGDIGSMDQAGRLYIHGRKKEMIVTPEGLKVFPDDVEAVINQIPGVRDSAVVGRERVHAVLLLEPGADKDEVVRRANERLESHQRIRSVSVWTSGELPRTEGTGKPRRGAIQSWVDAGSPPSAIASKDEITELLRRYAPGRTITPETTLDELGLSSLERVELMVEIEQNFNTTIDEAAFAKALKVADLAKQVALSGELRAPERPPGFVTWSRRAPMGLLRCAASIALILPFTRLCARLRITGLEGLSSLGGPVIFASNHQSHLDTPVILAALPSRWRYAIAPAMLKEFFAAHFQPAQYPLIRRLTNSLSYYLATALFNGFPLSQREPEMRETLRYIGELVDEGWSILIFPEGERTEAGEIKPFQPGVAMIGSALRLPVVPIRLRGVEKVLHRSARMVHPGPVEVAFGFPIVLKGTDYTALAKRVEDSVRAL